MAQGHTPDEFIEVEQLARCEAMLDALAGAVGGGVLIAVLRVAA